MKTIVSTIHGSRLFGTNHENSDTDIKTVFGSNLSELLTSDIQCFRDSSNEDKAFFSLKKFALLLTQQQTNALEILFTPSKFILERTEYWDVLVDNRAKVISKNIMPFIGYAKQQAYIYSEKGNNLNMLTELHSDLCQWFKYHSTTPETKAIDYVDGEYGSVKLDTILAKYPNLLSKGEKVSSSGTMIPFINILNKQFECFTTIHEWKSRLEALISSYGSRAKKAAKDGAFDRKAMYHALRIIDEAVELLEFGKLSLPRPDNILILLKAIRFDPAVSFNEASDLILDRYTYLLETALPKSTLQDTPDTAFINDWYLHAQSDIIKRELKIS